MRKLPLYTGIATAFLLAIFHSPVSHGIINGTPANSRNKIAQSTVAIFVDDELECTGSIINANTILTAAHCFWSAVLAPIRVKVGFGLNFKALQFRPVLRWTVNEDWHTLFVHGPEKNIADIALVQIDGVLPNGYAPIDIDMSKRQLNSGSKITIAGYGYEKANDQGSLGELRFARLRVKNFNYSETEMLIDQRGKHKFFQGDSGGPVVIMVHASPYLVAIGNHALDNSWNDLVATRTDRYVDWIARELQQKLWTSDKFKR